MRGIGEYLGNAEARVSEQNLTTLARVVLMRTS